MTAEEIREELFRNSDTKYIDFQLKLIPNQKRENMIGVRTPILRTLAKKAAKEPDTTAFLDRLPHKYYDETCLHGLIISECKDYNTAINRVNAFLPFVDNWAICDQLSPKVFAKNKQMLKSEIDKWIKSKEIYTVRFGIEMAMSHFLDEDFEPLFLKKVSKIRSGEYYINMMIAWYFATALAKQWDTALPYITESKLDKWTHNKTIQKAVESYRITDQQKALLKTYKMK